MSETFDVMSTIDPDYAESFENPVPPINWTATLIMLFQDRNEYWLARDAFNFHACYTRGETPEQAYAAFDAWAMGEIE